MAETSTLTRVDFGGFSMELDPQYLTMIDKANYQIFAQYMPPDQGGFIASNMNILWAAETDDGITDPETLRNYAGSVTGEMTDALTAEGLTVASCDVANIAVEEVDGKPVGMIMLLTLLDLSAYGMDNVPMYSFQILFNTDQGMNVITLTFGDEEEFIDQFGPILSSLKWN